MVKLLLLDKDGTLTESVSGEKFTNQPRDQKPIIGTIEALDRAVESGWTPVIISNQGGVYAGKKSLEDAVAEMRYALALFPKIKEAFFCPCSARTDGDHCWQVDAEPLKRPIILHSECFQPALRECGFRKPHPGMIHAAIATWRERGHTILEESCLFVGDMPEDQQAAVAANIKFVWAEDWRNG